MLFFFWKISLLAEGWHSRGQDRFLACHSVLPTRSMRFFLLYSLVQTSKLAHPLLSASFVLAQHTLRREENPRKIFSRPMTDREREAHDLSRRRTMIMDADVSKPPSRTPIPLQPSTQRTEAVVRPTAFEVSPVGGIKQGAGSSVASDNNIDIHLHGLPGGSNPLSDSDPRCKQLAAQGLCFGLSQVGKPYRNLAAACPVSCANQTSSCYCRVFDVPPIGPPVGDQCPCADGTSGITIQGRCMCSRVVGYPADQPCPCGASPLAPSGTHRV